MWTFTMAIVLYTFISTTPTPVSCTDNSITRAQIVDRAQFWVNQRIPYNETVYAPGPEPDGLRYRTDCSGFVSMAWNLSSSLNTRTLSSVSEIITKDQLQSGDILLNPGSHVLIFDKWVDSDKKVDYWAHELGNYSKKSEPQERVAKLRVINNYPYYGRAGSAPRRYKRLEPDTPTTTGVPPGDCKCPKYPDIDSLRIHYALAPTKCGFEMLGVCPRNDLYYCYYNYGMDPSGNPVSSTLLKECPFACKYFKWGGSQCTDTDREVHEHDKSNPNYPDPDKTAMATGDSTMIPDSESETIFGSNNGETARANSFIFICLAYFANLHIYT